MTDPRALQTDLEKDLLRAASTRKVLYLEGVTDVLVFFALVGQDPPTNVPSEGLPLDGIWIRRLTGVEAVKQRLKEAALHRQYAGLRGFIDGDGRDPPQPLGTFGAGPLVDFWRSFRAS